MPQNLNFRIIFFEGFTKKNVAGFTIKKTVPKLNKLGHVGELFAIANISRI